MHLGVCAFPSVSWCIRLYKDARFKVLVGAQCGNWGAKSTVIVSPWLIHKWRIERSTGARYIPSPLSPSTLRNKYSEERRSGNITNKCREIMHDKGVKWHNYVLNPYTRRLHQRLLNFHFTYDTNSASSGMGKYWIAACVGTYVARRMRNLGG